MMAAAGLTHNPILDQRDPDQLVGLKNLGATCYMVRRWSLERGSDATELVSSGATLSPRPSLTAQTWFQNRDFRRGVFACRPSGGEKPEESALFQLQVIFAALQEGISDVHNPQPLVTALRLQETEQQDAQECAGGPRTELTVRFGKLFIDLLAHEFQSQTEPSTASKSLITDLVRRRAVDEIDISSSRATCAIAPSARAVDTPQSARTSSPS